MASTKLEEASRLARPTPYMRNQNTNIEYAAKKTTPQSTKQNSPSNVDQSNKNNFQSNIPRFSSSLPASAASISGDHKTAVTNCNDNEAMHVVNNNAIVNSRSAYNVSHSPVTKTNLRDSQIKPKIGSRSCPDKIVSPDAQDKPAKSPLRGTGIFRSFLGKSSPKTSSNSPDSLETPKSQSRVTNGKSSKGASPATKSPSRKGFASLNSLSDFDSGIGNSLNDKNRPEDSDTIKDVEQIEFQEEFSPNLSVDAVGNRPTSTPKSSASDSKLSLKAPTYRREQNGKWSYDEKHFGSEPLRTPEPKPILNTGSESPREKHTFKMNASENIFSTYASYKGLLSYQKKSFKPSDVKYNLRDKTNQNDRTTPQQTSSIPKVPTALPNTRRPASQARSSKFYVNNEHSKVDEEEKTLSAEKLPKSSNAKQSSLDSDEKSDSTENGVTSPPSDDNREFLIDDEIADQPGLTFFGDPNSEDSDVQSLKQAMTELHALQMTSSLIKKRTDSCSSYSSLKRRSGGDHRDSLILGSELGSSCSSIASDDLMLDYDKAYDGFPEGTVNEGLASPMRKLSEVEPDKVAPLMSEKRFDFEEKSRKRLVHRRSSGTERLTPAERIEMRQRTISLPLRPPRQMQISEADDGGLKLDSSSYRLLCQDLNGVKTMLLRLKTVIQEAETINPFDQSNPNNLFYHTLAQTDFPAALMISPKGENKGPDAATLFDENADLRRQVVLLQQQLEDKDKTIHLLQQQMTKYLNVQGGCNHNIPNVNAATQTERSHSLTGSLSSSSFDDSIETLVSVQDAFEKSFRKNSKEQDVLSGHLIEVVRLLDQMPQPNQSEC
ncbi:hypothetical protein JTE90_007169 [Oedothorax gibbosus]|uniref:Uncharacterized protein n=1 Tax=Oedothorax gibbosus TaxID=931172 RepID=A0AAV6UYH1_9ARAC|nr:hypothetical protein JTE90_007169 [Oedothorax gibbosus]